MNETVKQEKKVWGEEEEKKSLDEAGKLVCVDKRLLVKPANSIGPDDPFQITLTSLNIESDER